MIAKAEQRRVAIDTIWIGRGPVWSRNTLVRMAERTDGLHHDAKYAGEIQAAFGKVMDQINGAFIASFDRKLEEGLTTRRLGVSLNQPGVAAPSIALSTPIPRSSTRPTEEAPRSSGGFLHTLWGIIANLDPWIAALAGDPGALPPLSGRLYHRKKVLPGTSGDVSLLSLSSQRSGRAHSRTATAAAAAPYTA